MAFNQEYDNFTQQKTHPKIIEAGTDFSAVCLLLDVKCSLSSIRNPELEVLSVLY